MRLEAHRSAGHRRAPVLAPVNDFTLTGGLRDALMLVCGGQADETEAVLRHAPAGQPLRLPNAPLALDARKPLREAREAQQEDVPVFWYGWQPLWVSRSGADGSASCRPSRAARCGATSNSFSDASRCAVVGSASSRGIPSHGGLSFLLPQ